jgi:glycosyltransferase involved in cell wall biosynthesis
MRIVFLHHGLEIDGNSLETKPLGGTETALLSVAKALAARPGLEVSIFTRTPEAASFSGVRFAPLSQFHAWAAAHPIDVLVSVRIWLPLWLPIRARLRVYLSPDAPDQPFLRKGFDVATRIGGKAATVPVLGPAHFVDDVDAFFCVGQWQAREFVSTLGFPAGKIFVTGNGVHLANFDPRPLAERTPAMLYSSTPFRGLAHLAGYFAQIKRQCPAATLDVCSSMTVYGLSAADDERQFGALYDELRDAGATLHGALRQAELHALMCRARVFAYPNTFPETFCISALEAQAAGLPVVTTRRAGLAERVDDGIDGFLIDGEPGDAAYDREFVERTLLLLTNDEQWQAMSEAAIAKAQHFTYERIAQSWIAYFEDRLANAQSRLPYVDIDALGRFETASSTDPEATIVLEPAEVAHLVKAAMTKFFGPRE